MTVRVAVVGCGAVAQRVHLPGLRSAGAEVVAFASRSRSSSEEAARQWGGGEVLDDWRAVLKHPGVDALDVCTPNANHAEIALAAAAAGKHVLVEKPMAMTVEEADRMAEAARRSRVVLMPAHNARFRRPFVAMREAVATGDIGRVVAFRCAWGHAGPQEWAPTADWFRDPARSGGGALIDLGVHAADVLRAVLDDEPVAVSALLWPDPAPADAGDGRVEELAQLVVRFSEGALGTLQASWAVSTGADHQLTVQGTTGTLHLDTTTPPTLVPAGGGDPHRLPLPERGRGMFEAFVAAIEQGTQPAVTAADGRAAVAVVAAAYRSAASGRVEPVESPGGGVA